MSTQLSERRLRRRELAGLAAGGLAAAGVYALTKGNGNSSASTAGRQAPHCVLTPELTEGPYYLPSEPFRRNVTEGRPGWPLILGLTVVDAGTCRPIKGASVEIWHADAGGNYSGFGAQDGIYAQGGSASVVRLRRRRKGKGLRGSLTMGVSA
jgi:protocatechuate 3,4-dioxygenase beta subunit